MFCCYAAFRKAVGGVVAEAPAPDLSLLDHLLHRLAELLEGDLPSVFSSVVVLKGLTPIRLRLITLGPVKQVHVGVIGLKAFEGTVEVLLDVLGHDVGGACDFSRDRHGFAVDIARLHPVANRCLRLTFGRSRTGGDRVLLRSVDGSDAARIGKVEEVEAR